MASGGICTVTGARGHAERIKEGDIQKNDHVYGRPCRKASEMKTEQLARSHCFLACCAAYRSSWSDSVSIFAALQNCTTLMICFPTMIGLVTAATTSGHETFSIARMTGTGKVRMNRTTAGGRMVRDERRGLS